MKLLKVEVKRGSRVLGHIITEDDGRRYYLHRRKIADIYRPRTEQPSSISTAVREDTASWGIDEETLFRLRREEVEQAGVVVHETGETYLAPLELFFESGMFHTVSRARGSERCLPFSRFVRRAGKIRV